jgi:transitional endoplasmic reticulum ATPase
VLWLSNAIWQMEPATLRRFRLALEVTVPTQGGRRQIVGKYLGHLPVSAPWLDRLAEHEELPPAVLEQVAEVAAELTGSTSEGLEDTLQRLLGQTLSAMGVRASLRKPAVEATPYRVDVLHTDADLAALAAALRHDPRGRLCLYGPPGTGKTAFGRYLAQVLDRPLLLKRASDLLSKWLGETEQRIARMFEEAEHDGALLLLDEADSLLRERARAHVSWEVTQVNEILTQLEGFDGLFLCCTNLMEDLDAASLRRFDLKIHFDYLRPGQAWTLFREVVVAHGGRSPSARAWKTRLATLPDITPGDFATVVRRQRLTAGPLRAATLLNGLAREVWARRRDKGRGIGFAAPL